MRVISVFCMRVVVATFNDVKELFHAYSTKITRYLNVTDFAPNYMSSRAFRCISLALMGGVFLTEVSHVQASEPESAQPRWDGQYVGATLGVSYGSANSNTRVRRSGYFVAADEIQLNPLLDDTIDGADFAGSLIWGYNRQKGKWVYGVEANLIFSNFDETNDSGTVTYVSQPADTFQFTAKLQTYATASLLPRVGYVRDKSMFYISAGPALSVFEYDFQFTDTFQPQFSSTGETRIKIGTALNLGIEHRLREDISLRANYLFTYFPNAVDTSGNLATSLADGFEHEFDYQNHSLHIGLVKRF